jgi:hypothetical protein
MKIAWLCLLAAAGCYHPNIPEGSLFCETGTMKCPSGFSCAADGKCYQSPPDLGPQVYGSGSLGSLDLTGKSGTLMLDTDTGEIDLIPSGGMSTTLIPAGSASMQPQSAGPTAAIWSFLDVEVPGGLTVAASGAGLPVLAATQRLIFLGDIDVSGAANNRGFGGMNGSAGLTGGTAPGNGSGGGGGGSAGTSGGGGGGGNAVNGSPGMGSGAGSAGPALGGGATIELFGAGGGGGGSTATSTGGDGGLGGGAFVLLSPMIDIEGLFDVSGDDGSTATLGNAGGGGGGAGGSILMSGQNITIGAHAKVLANAGGGGAASGTGGKGGAGAVGRIHLAGTVANSSSMVMPQPTMDAAPLGMFP